MNQPRRKLKIDMMDLELAFESRDDLFDDDYFLDLETGDVIMATGEEDRLLEEIYELYSDPDTGEVDWPTVLAQLDIPEWQKEPLIVGDQIEAGFGTRYIRIPHVESRDGYYDMVAFIRTVSNPRLQSCLERAISGRGAFRYFKDDLLDYPKERERWFRFQDERMRERILDWLESEGVEPIEGNG